MLYDERYFDARVATLDRRLGQSASRGYLRHLSKFQPDLMNGEGKRALDIGCGVGNTVTVLRGSGYDAYGTDVSNYAVSVARRAIGSSDKLVVADAASSIPFVITFDLITSFEVIEHLPNPGRAFGNWHEAANRDCKLVLSTPNPASPISPIRSDPTHISLKRASEWRQLLEQNGWHVIRICARQYLPIIWKMEHRFRFVSVPFSSTNLILCINARD